MVPNNGQFGARLTIILVTQRSYGKSTVILVTIILVYDGHFSNGYFGLHGSFWLKYRLRIGATPRVVEVTTIYEKKFDLWSFEPIYGETGIKIDYKTIYILEG